MTEVRSTLMEVLSRLLSPDLNDRQTAETHLQALQVTEGKKHFSRYPSLFEQLKVVHQL